MKSKGKRVADSVSEMLQIVLPNDTNVLGNLLGGTLMHWIDLAGATVANRHCRLPIVTASMEALAFLAPIPLGYLVILQGKIVYAGRSSMEVALEVYSEDTLSGKRNHTSSGLLTYVAVDMAGKSVPVPKLILTSDEEKRLFQEAIERKEQRVVKLNKKSNKKEIS